MKYEIRRKKIFKTKQIDIKNNRLNLIQEQKDMISFNFGTLM